jgi:hypothetical protein
MMLLVWWEVHGKTGKHLGYLGGAAVAGFSFFPFLISLSRTAEDVFTKCLTFGLFWGSSFFIRYFCRDVYAGRGTVSSALVENIAFGILIAIAGACGCWADLTLRRKPSPLK